ncbi:alpha/beta fold hydrolase [Roseomonas sp. WA12]
MGLFQRITSGRAELAVEVVGQGDPVVFLHANVCDSRMWGVQMRELGPNYRAIAYDRRGFGRTSAEEEDFSAIEDLMAVIDGCAGSMPPILVGCSQGGKIAIDAALRYPSRIRALVLIAPSVGGAPEANYLPGIAAVLSCQKAAEDAGDLDRVNAIKARLWLDGPMAPEGRVTGDVRALFLDMNAIALRSPPTGPNLDTAPAFDRLHEVSMPTIVLWGDVDFPHIQERCRHIVNAVPKASGHKLSGTAHLPSMEQQVDITGPLRSFIEECSGRPL